ncbi:MAG: glycosyltransferase family 39 protein, partial [Actinomycetota bacterium]|nr:glycosyltransferase family 39 protein [Actinomycetota bacterium]
IHQHGEFEQSGPGTPAHPQPASNYSPGLPLLTGALFEIAGDDDVRLVRVLLALIGTIAIPLVFLIGRRLSPWPPDSNRTFAAAVSGAAFCAFYPTLVSYSQMLLTEPLAGTLIAGGLLAVLRARDQDRLLPWLGAGFLLGLATMVRPEYLLVFAVLAATLALVERHGGFRHAAAPAAMMLLGVLLVIAPWTIRNFAEFQRVVPLSTGGGQALYSGSYVASGGNPTKVVPDLLARQTGIRAELAAQNRISGEGPGSVTPERVFSLLAERTLPHLETDEALSRLGRERYADELRRDPAGLFAFLGHKTLRIWWRGRSDLMHHFAGPPFHRLIILAALAGLLSLAFRRRTEFWIFAAVVVTVTVIGTVLVASPRRALVLWPLVSVFAGLGLTIAFTLARDRLQRRRRPVAIA